MKVLVARASELPPGECKVVRANGREVALYNVAGTFYATDNQCLHRGGALGEGVLQGHMIICPVHYWKYDVRTGEQEVDSRLRVACFPVVVEQDDVYVDL